MHYSCKKNLLFSIYVWLINKFKFSQLLVYCVFSFLNRFLENETELLRFHSRWIYTASICKCLDLISLSRFWSITSFESPADFHGDEIKEIWTENWRLFLTTLSGIDLHKMWHVCSGCPIKGHVKIYKFLNIHTYPPISDISTRT